MSLPDINCPTCGNRGVDQWHLSRCAYIDHCLSEVIAHAKGYDIPEVTARDLFAHMREIGGDVERAYRFSLRVMDLGWRPVVGSQSQRLWCAPDEVPA